MCGIFGALISRDNGFTDVEKEAFIGNMFTNAWRGRDSTGIIQVSKDGDLFAIKTVGDPYHIVVNEEFKPWYRQLGNTAKIAFGHGRWATRGLVDINNAHPFHAKGKDGQEIVFIHNGTLAQYQQIPGIEKYDVDSQWLAQCIADLGPEETLSKVYGPMAIMWWNDTEKMLYAYRNDDRPLHIATDKLTGTVYINSTIGTLHWLRDTFHLGFAVDAVKTLAPGSLYKFPLKDPTLWNSTKIEPYRPPYIPPTHGVGRTVPLIGMDGYTDIDRVAASNQPCTPDDQFYNTVMDMYGGRWKKILYLQTGAKYLYNNQDICTPMPKVGPPWSIPELRRVEMKGPEKAAFHLHHADHSMELLVYNKKEFENWWKKRVELDSPLAVGVTAKPSSQVLFRTQGNINGKVQDICHRGFTDKERDAWMWLYQNDFDGTFEVGSRITWEPWEFLKTPEGSTIARGGLISPNGGADVIVEAITKLYNEKEFCEAGHWLGTIVGMRLNTVEQKKVGVGDIVFLVNQLRRADMADKDDTALLKLQKELTWKKAIVNIPGFKVSDK